MKRSLKSLDGVYKARVVYGGMNTFIETNCITVGTQQYRELPNGQIVQSQSQMEQDIMLSAASQRQHQKRKDSSEYEPSQTSSQKDYA